MRPALVILILLIPSSLFAQRFSELDLKVKDYYRLGEKVTTDFKMVEKSNSWGGITYRLEDTETFEYESGIFTDSDSYIENITHKKGIMVTVLSNEIEDTKKLDFLMKLEKYYNQKSDFRTDINIINEYDPKLKMEREVQKGDSTFFTRINVKVERNKMYQIISLISGTDSDSRVYTLHSSFLDAVTIY